MEEWQIRKPSVTSTGGLVSAQHVVAARIGAGVLARGGNAVDGAVAAAFAQGVCEPWLSGIVGGGFMVIHVARERRTHVVDFSMVTPVALDPARYRIAGGVGAGLFAWPAVEGDRNLRGYESICVPGAVDGLGLALERFGTIGFAEALAPSIALAEEGLPVDWYTTLSIALEAPHLAVFPDTRAVYLPDGLPPATPIGASTRRLALGRLPDTLRRLADRGRRELYEGDLAQSIVRDVRAGGGALAEADLAGYRAAVTAPLQLGYRGITLNAPRG